MRWWSERSAKKACAAPSYVVKLIPSQRNEYMYPAVRKSPDVSLTSLPSRYLQHTTSYKHDEVHRPCSGLCHPLFRLRRRCKYEILSPGNSLSAARPKISYHGVHHCDHHLLPPFHFQATFYGQGGAGQGGACMLERGFNGVGITVAINQAQWDGAGSCGKCIKVRKKGVEWRKAWVERWGGTRLQRRNQES